MYTYRASLVRVVDGDTVDLDVDLGFYMTARIRFRLADIDAPEVRGAEKAAGKASKAYLQELLDEVEDSEIQYLAISTSKADSFGRWLATLWVVDDDAGEAWSINQRMIEDGYAEPYKK